MKVEEKRLKEGNFPLRSNKCRRNKHVCQYGIHLIQKKLVFKTKLISQKNGLPKYKNLPAPIETKT